ncbi:SGNH/GDSL hydrolase family protein [Neptunomonas sp.]|uniref:SGNH/GDSL hydrolase family protein n=1 Tax=Neptunomonas sp. TaxID=1971898 RepID=UPI0025E09CAC|nr:SGNH/GDSL hydrolase family protein [Neptunomonas sp.]
MFTKTDGSSHVDRTTQNIRLIALGDCNTSGINHSSVASILHQRLNQLSKSSQTCYLDNHGEAMRTTREGLAITKDLNKSFDIALINYGLVDAWTTTIPKVYIQYYPDNRVKRILRKALKSLKKRLRKTYFNGLFKTGSVVSTNEYKENIDAIMTSLHQYNPNIFFILWGSVPVEDEPRNTNLLDYDNILKAQTGKYNGCYIDTRKTISAERREDMFHDEVHLSEAAQEMIANKILAELEVTA